MEDRHAVVLQEPPQDAHHPHILGQPLHPGPQSAHSPHDAVNPDASPRGLVQLSHQNAVVQAVDLEQDGTAPATPTSLDLAVNHLRNLISHVHLGHQQLPVTPHGLLLVQAREVFKDVRGVPSKLRVAAEQAEVRVKPRGDGVVVPSADVDVGPQGLPRGDLPPDDEHDLAVGLEADQAIGNGAARSLELLGVRNVPLLVETSLELHKDGDLLPRLRGLHQGLDHRGVIRRPVHGGLDGEHVWVAGTLLQQP